MPIHRLILDPLTMPLGYVYIGCESIMSCGLLAGVIRQRPNDMPELTSFYLTNSVYWVFGA